MILLMSTYTLTATIEADGAGEKFTLAHLDRYPIFLTGESDALADLAVGSGITEAAKVAFIEKGGAEFLEVTITGSVHDLPTDLVYDLNISAVPILVRVGESIASHLGVEFVTEVNIVKVAA
jgi:hypothetical protein